jgi:hypothetical protein
MSLRLGDEAPNFQAKTTAGDIDFYDYIDGKWAAHGFWVAGCPLRADVLRASHNIRDGKRGCKTPGRRDILKEFYSCVTTK